jgi:hypothetical protein
MEKQFEQLIGLLNARYDSVQSQNAVLTDPFAEDLNLGVHAIHNVEPVVSPSPRQSFMRRVADRAIEASYSAGAKWTTLTSKQKRVMGLATLAGVAAGVGIGVLDHGSAVQGPHFFDAAYHPGQLHPTLMSNMHDHVHAGFSAEVNGHTVESTHSSGQHFSAEVNGKPVHPHITHQPVTAPKAVHKPTPALNLKEHFVAEVNHQPVTASELHQSAHPVANTIAHHAHHVAHHTHTGKLVDHHLQGQHHNKHFTHHHKTHFGHQPTPGTTFTMKSGDNPWTISQRALHIPFNGHNTQHQLHQIWLYDQHILHLNNISTEQAKYLQIGRKLLLPNS